MESAPARIGHRRVVFTATLMFAMAAGTLIRFAIGLLAPFLVSDLGVTRTGLGGLAAALFVTAGLLSPSVGASVDKLGGRRLLHALFAFTGLGLVGMAVAPSYLWLVVAIAVGGIPLAISNPATNALVAAHAAPGQRGMIMGLKQSGVQVGALLAGAFLPSAATFLGWRPVLLLAAAMTATGVIATVSSVPTDQSDQGRDVGNSADFEEEQVLDASERSTVRWLAIYSFFAGAGTSAVVTYLPLYAVETLGFTASAAGLVMSVMAAVAVAARIAWGYGAERISRAGFSLAGLAILAVVAQAMMWIAPIVGGSLLWLGALVFGASAPASVTVIMLTVIREVTDGDEGRATGFVQLPLYVGLTVGPIAYGALVDVTGSYDVGSAAVVGVFLFATATATWQHLVEVSRPNGVLLERQGCAQQPAGTDSRHP